jgi:hypothetical protein
MDRRYLREVTNSFYRCAADIKSQTHAGWTLIKARYDDVHDVSFVSVTQQFNTTTSMGRLTLNVLLSFAQFERVENLYSKLPRGAPARLLAMDSARTGAQRGSYRRAPSNAGCRPSTLGARPRASMAAGLAGTTVIQTRPASAQSTRDVMISAKRSPAIGNDLLLKS